MFTKNRSSTLRNPSPSNLWTLIGTALVVVVAVGACNSGPDKVEIVPNNERAGERGESCEQSTDCKESLACVNNRCIKNEYNISASASECRRVECQNRDDCCELSEQCQMLEDECEEQGDGSPACEQFDNINCGECNMQCENRLCVQETPACQDDDDCGLSGTCENGQCVQCAEDSDCSGDAECRSGVCEEPCEVNEECPLFQECSEGECVETGCTSDRECVLYLEDGTATCSDGECLLPCQNDAECNQGTDGYFNICNSNGRCEFVGCENDAECRVVLDLENTDDAEAVCTNPNTGDGGNGN